MKLICVVLKEESPEQFYDTVKLFDYGFTNFSVANVAENETKYSIQNSNFFNTSSDVFGNSTPVLFLNKNSYLIMPKNITFQEMDSQISYDTTDENQVAVIQYSYHGVYLGTATLDRTDLSPVYYEFEENTDMDGAEAEQKVIVVNVTLILGGIAIFAALVIAVIMIRSVIRSYNIPSGRGVSRRWKRNKRKRKDGPHFPSSRFNGVDL